MPEQIDFFSLESLTQQQHELVCIGLKLADIHRPRWSMRKRLSASALILLHDEEEFFEFALERVCQAIYGLPEPTRNDRRRNVGLADLLNAASFRPANAACAAPAPSAAPSARSPDNPG